MGNAIWLLFALVFVTAASADAQTRTLDSAMRDFARLKSLAGEWTGTMPDGSALKVSYQLTSGGSVVMEHRQPANEPPMITVFHLDRRRLMLTHYCSAGNHPRMAARAAPESPALEFTTTGVANLRSPSEDHMRGLRFDFKSPDEIVQTWTWRAKGKDIPGPVTLKRQSPSNLP